MRSRPGSRCRASRGSRSATSIFLVTGAFGIVFLALAESIGAARSFAARHGYEIDPDQELIALGASNVASGLFGGFAVDASFSQSATGEAAGTRTQLSSLITAGLVLATAVVLAPIFRNLPTAVLAAIVITSVMSLVNVAELRRYLAWKRTDFLLAMTALGGVVFTTALTGMAIAVALSLLAILYQASRPYIAVLGRLPGRRRWSTPTRSAIPRPSRSRGSCSSGRTSR